MKLQKIDIPKVLIVDDKPENLSSMSEMLQVLDLDIYKAMNIQEIHSHLEIHDFDLILLDIILPDVNGYEICKELKNDNQHKDIPIIFVSSLVEVNDRLKGFESGADDYITKPFLKEELIARVKLHLQKASIFKSLKNLLRKSFHELYNPLNIINSSLEMNELKYGNNIYTDAIQVASKSLQMIYDDLYYSLSTSKKHSKINSIDLVWFTQQRIKYFYHTAKSNNMSITLNSDEKNLIQIREEDLLRIIDNTLSNAIKYGYSDTEIIINISNKDAYVVFECINKGLKITNPKKLFSKGYREGYEKIGMGIGLEIVSSICNTYNIETDVSSTNSQNSFKYTIPKRFIG